jgi:hypothetical protein
MLKHPELTAGQREALQAFADAHGRKWKSQLSDVYWYNARIWTGPVPGMGNTLHEIRNTYGPGWLFSRCDIKPARKGA